jgi:hypothetical protein
MGNEIRRSLDELAVRYELEPELRDIYVEGRTDKLLFDWFLQQKGIRDFTVYEIDTVEIPTQRLFELGLVDNNRSRVIALALEMQNRLAEIPLHLTCIADKDFDYLFAKEYTCSLLLFTDYSCIEMYFFHELILDKCFCLALRLPQLKAHEVINHLSPVLEQFFLIRATNQSLELNMEWLSDFGGCCELNKNRHINFNLEKFIDKYLNKNNKMKDKLSFMTKFSELSKIDLKDIRYKVRGHDFIELLLWYVRPYLNKEIRNPYKPDILAGNLLVSIEVEKLAQEGLFQKLLARITN